MPPKKSRKKKTDAVEEKKGAYVVTVDMGYGHQRAVYPLKDIAICPPGCMCGKGHIITANNYAGIPKSDRRRWQGSRKIYEKISRLKHVPIIGNWVFDIMDYFQRIQPFYPKRDLSKPNLQLSEMYRMIGKGWGKHLVDMLNEHPLPLITSFFTVGFFAEEHGYKEDIYVICTDADVSRSWAPLTPKKAAFDIWCQTSAWQNACSSMVCAKNRFLSPGFHSQKKILASGENCAS